jgi:hypothetical protein
LVPVRQSPVNIVRNHDSEILCGNDHPADGEHGKLLHDPSTGAVNRWNLVRSSTLITSGAKPAAPAAGCLIVDYIKMDIEGAEYRALLGMRGLIERSPQVSLLMEWESHSAHAAETLRLVRSMGFRVHDCPDDGPMTLSSDEFLLRNILAHPGSEPFPRSLVAAVRSIETVRRLRSRVRVHSARNGPRSEGRAEDPRSGSASSAHGMGLLVVLARAGA